MRVETVSAHGPARWAIGLVGTQTERFRKVTLTAADLETLTIIQPGFTYDGDGQLLRLGSRLIRLVLPTSLTPTLAFLSPVLILFRTSLKPSTTIF